MTTSLMLRPFALPLVPLFMIVLSGFANEQESTSAPSVVAEPRLARESKSFTFSYPEAELVVRRTPQYVLFFHEPSDNELDNELDIERAMQTVRDASRVVNDEMGGVRNRQVHIFFPLRITSKKDDGKVAGLRFDRGEQSCIAFKAPSFGPEKARHEFAHEWFRSNPELEPEHWSIEEGICEYFEYPGEVHPKHLEYLRGNGTMTKAALAVAERAASEKWIRATRWLQVYWLRHLAEETRSLREIATLNPGQYPRPQEALEDLLVAVDSNARSSGIQ